ncbi:MAG: porin [Oleispira antarctica]|jgi:hypothetical protein|uniref:Uncharacterized protein n=1 Tax=Oleispira antarctica RB-8 TaxID=698738 RepID=R4YMP2_OLEAN|nr:porin [Oleispira antarctica]MBQ0792381.1 porin [Oleispira antarctica]CCK76256.1 conserved hypothetical protein [Oleispira antarctica RB-8]
MRTRKYWAPSLLAMAIASPAMASDLNVNGFMSVGASMLDKDNGTEVAGADNQGGFKQDTILGLQVSKQVNDSTSITGQLVSRGSDDYATEAAWAFVTYAVNDELDLRMGRLRIPAFYYSDFLEVGYTYNSIRPAEEVYRLPFSSVDGIDITKRFSSGNVDGSVQFYYGRYIGDFSNSGSTYDADFRNLTGISLTTNMGDFGGRISYNQAELNLQGDPPAGSDLALGILGAQALAGSTDAAEDFNITGQTSQFIAAALTYDNGTYSALAEWTALNQETDLLMDDQAWLVSVATRMGEFTPHITYSTQKDEYESGRVGQIQKQLGLATEESSITVGVRYDYDSSTALKFEIQNHDEKTIKSADGDSATLYSVAVDLVF